MDHCSKMMISMKAFVFAVIFVALSQEYCESHDTYHRFIVKETKFKKLCQSKKILTVNGQFPGPTLYVHRGDTIFVDVHNQAKHNITLHWHGVKQPRNPWSDGPEYITQCPIQSGQKFRQKLIFSDEEGTLWWHAHSDWARATVHGAIIVYPRLGTNYPFPQPHAQIPILLGEWWKEDVQKVFQDFVESGGQPRNSDAFTINGQPGDFYPCSEDETFKQDVVYGETYLLRIINAGMNQILFFTIAEHKLTVVGIDASYTKPLTRDFIAISPGQTVDCILHANKKPDQYYMAARAYLSAPNVDFDNTTTTAIIHYQGSQNPSSFPILPFLPNYNDTSAAFDFTSNLRSLASETHPIFVPKRATIRIFTTISVNTLPCPLDASNSSCQGPNFTRLGASMTNISFITPSFDILEAYYHKKPGVFGDYFPDFPPVEFNYTDDLLPMELAVPSLGTEVKVLRYNDEVEIVFQVTNLVAGIDHPIHLHGYSFYVVGQGFGNFNESFDPYDYNLVDPPRQNTVMVPRNGWATIRFKANNPGVWFVHCHFERHLTWGMGTVFIVKDGELPEERLSPPPQDMPPC